MRFKILIFLIYLFLLSIKVAADPNPIKENVEDILNVGRMVSHDKSFTLFFKTRKKAILAKGEEFNYITDYPQDLYIYNNKHYL